MVSRWWSVASNPAFSQAVRIRLAVWSVVPEMSASPCAATGTRSHPIQGAPASLPGESQQGMSDTRFSRGEIS